MTWQQAPILQRVNEVIIETLLKKYLVHLDEKKKKWWDQVNFAHAMTVELMQWPGARPTKHISIEFEIRWKFRTL